MAFRTLLESFGYQNIVKSEEYYTAIKHNKLYHIKISDNNELNALQTLKYVPELKGKIAELVSIIDTKKRKYAVIEWINGTTLEDSILTDSMKEDIALSLVSIIKIIHSNGWVHGDIHSENILINNGKVILIDFGSASNNPNPKIHPLYPPPESLTEKSLENILGKYRIKTGYYIDQASDWWALGLMLFTLFTGEMVPGATSFMLDDPKFKLEEIYLPFEPRENLKPWINDLLKTLLSHDPKTRNITN